MVPSADTNEELEAEIRRLRETNEELALSGSILRAAFDSTANGILVLDGRGRISAMNRKFREIWHVPDNIEKPDEGRLLLGLILYQIKESEVFLGRVKHLYSQPEAPSSDVIELKDGRFFERHSKPFMLGENNMGRVWSFYDITDRKRLEETERRRSAELSTLIDSLPGIAFFKDNSSTYVTVNRTHCQMLGKTRKRIVGKKDLDLFPTSKAERILADDMRVLSGEAPFTEREEELITNNKKTIISMKKVPVKDKDGVIHGLIGLGFDITARKAAEEELRKLSNAIEQSPVSIVITDRNGNIEYVNPKFTEVTGFTTAEAVGNNPRILKSGELSGEAYKTLWDTITSGRSWNGEFHNRKKNGKLYWELASISPVLSDSGEITHFIAVKEDITERKRAEESLRTAKMELETLNRQLQSSIGQANQFALEAQAASVAKSQFLANMSHEIRTPMNGVIGMTGLLLDTALTEEQKGYTRIIRSSADSLLTIINDILDFSKIEAGKLEMETLDFDLRATMADMVEMFIVNAGKSGLAFDWAIHADTPSLLRGDPGRLRQILTNLIGNAIKFTPEGKVTLAVKPEKEEGGRVTLLFTVTDTGIGIPGDRMDRLFKPFSQADPSATRKYGGTGLGLMISKKLVELMGGTVGVKSEEGKGSTFWFTSTFERQTAGEWKSKTPEGVPGPIITRCRMEETKKLKLRILIAEDNTINQKVTLGILNKLGFRADVAANGKEVLTALDMIPYDLIFMDIQMPEMDGFEATAAIRLREGDRDSHIPIIAMTAHAMEEDRLHCLAAGMDDYVSKPVSPKSLIDAIERQAFRNMSGHDRTPETELDRGIADSRKADVFDRAALLRTLDGDEDLLWELVAIFIGDMPGQIERLKEALINKDMAAIVSEAHRGKGAAANLRAPSISKLFSRIEMSGKEKRPENIAQLLKDMEREFDSFRTLLKREDLDEDISGGR
jgi:PAS domain S-box-containing protein